MQVPLLHCPWLTPCALQLVADNMGQTIKFFLFTAKVGLGVILGFLQTPCC
jgi:hypothetical protein